MSLTAARSNRLSWRVDYGSPLLAEPLNAKGHHITGLKVNGGCKAEADAGGCPGDNNITGHQRHKLRDIMDDKGRPKDHVGGGAILITVIR